MAKRGVPIQAIDNARRSPSRAHIKALIFAAAPCYPLGEVLALFPEAAGNSKAKGGRAHTKLKGKAAFFDEDARNPDLFSQFFCALARPNFTLDGTLYNPLTYCPPPSICFVLSDCSKLSYMPFLLIGGTCVRRTQMTSKTLFSLYNGPLQKAPNYSYILQLLERECHLPLPSQVKRRPELKKKAQWIRTVAPLFRREIALREQGDSAKAFKFVNPLQEQEASSFPAAADILALHLSEIHMGLVGATTSRGKSADILWLTDQLLAGKFSFLSTEMTAHGFVLEEEERKDKEKAQEFNVYFFN